MFEFGKYWDMLNLELTNPILTPINEITIDLFFWLIRLNHII
jgi:hypothetical protein